MNTNSVESSMTESQHIEFKQNWHDDYLKWIVAFANSRGGKMFIGKDDNGNVTGIANHKLLLEELPNKIRDILGIVVEINLHQSENRHFLEIQIPSYSVPISLRGRYYIRSGSTKQELTGSGLNEFLLRKSGQTWDELPELRATLDDIETKTIEHFLAASKATDRLPEQENLTLPQLLEKLRLLENGQLKRAALILFGKDPKKFYPGAFVKIGRFGKSATDLLFHEVEEGNLFQLLDSVLNQLNHKFLTRSVSFEGMSRIETLPYPVPALREMLLNALIHRNYFGPPIQIRVFDDKLSVWNEGTLPNGVTVADLKQIHSSKPRNINIADVVFKGGFIDSWGRGTLKILEACKEFNLPEPTLAEQGGGFEVTLYRDKWSIDQLESSGLNDRQIQAVLFVKRTGRITNKQYQQLFPVARETVTRDLTDLLERQIFKHSGRKGAGSFYYLD